MCVCMFQHMSQKCYHKVRVGKYHMYDRFHMCHTYHVHCVACRACIIRDNVAHSYVIGIRSDVMYIYICVCVHIDVTCIRCIRYVICMGGLMRITCINKAYGPAVA